jgi:hypothetical protein
MLGPLVEDACEEAAPEDRLSGVFSPPVFRAGEYASAAGAQMSAARPSNGVATRRIACESCDDLIIEGTTPRRVDPVIGRGRGCL